MNWLYSKQNKSKHNVAIETWARQSVVAYPHPPSYSMQRFEHRYVHIICLC